MTTEEFYESIEGSWWELHRFSEEYEVGPLYETSIMDEGELICWIADRVRDCDRVRYVASIIDDIDVNADMWFDDWNGDMISAYDSDFDEFLEDTRQEAISAGIIVDETDEEREERERLEAEERQRQEAEAERLRTLREQERAEYIAGIDALMLECGMLSVAV